MRYTSRDGVMSSADPGAVALWERICDEHTDAQRRWSALLREMGVKLEHPDDGWVHRDQGYLSLSWYARFNDNPQEGDLIALGWPRSGYRLVRVTRVERDALLIPCTHYHFEDTGVRVPEPPRPGLLARLRAIRPRLAARRRGPGMTLTTTRQETR